MISNNILEDKKELEEKVIGGEISWDEIGAPTSSKKLARKKAEATPREPDEYDQLEFPPPSDDPDFRRLWAIGLEGITGRKNFIPAHLSLYETYCALTLQVRRLEKFLAENGMVSAVKTRMGKVRRPHPEVQLLTSARNTLVLYAKMLDVIPSKDKSATPKKKDAEEWG